MADRLRFWMRSPNGKARKPPRLGARTGILAKPRGDFRRPDFRFASEARTSRYHDDPLPQEGLKNPGASKRLSTSQDLRLPTPTVLSRGLRSIGEASPVGRGREAAGNRF